MVKDKKRTAAFIAVYFIFFAALLIIGSFKDFEIEKEVFNPQNFFAKLFETWGEAPRFAMWGPAATVLLFTRRSIKECFTVFHRLLPFIPEISEKQTQTKAYKFFNFIVNAIEIIGFTVLAVLGWDKLIRNIGKYYVDLSKAVWYIIAAVVAAIVILIFTKIPKRILYKLEPLALCVILIGIFYCFLDPIKSIVNRARFREMVAFSNGIENSRGANITPALIPSSDFSYYTEWYQKGFGGTLLNGFELEGTSCPSGHVMSGCFIFLSTLLCSAFERLKKYKTPVCILCFAYTAALSLTRMMRGAHFLSDIALGALLGMIFFLVSAGVLRIFEKKRILERD